MSIKFILLGLGFWVAAFTGVLWIRLGRTNQRVKNELEQEQISRLARPGTIGKLTLLPLVEYYANGPYATEAGVSYLIQADEIRLLLDVGANEKKGFGHRHRMRPSHHTNYFRPGQKALL